MGNPSNTNLAWPWQEQGDNKDASPTMLLAQHLRLIHALCGSGESVLVVALAAEVLCLII